MSQKTPYVAKDGNVHQFLPSDSASKADSADASDAFLSSPPTPKHTPGPWTYWLDEDESKNMIQAGIDCGTPENRGAGIAEILVETIEKDDHKEAVAVARADARLMAAAPELLEALDNVTASLETVMTWFGEKMGREDRLSRFKNIADARNIIAKALEG